MKYPLILIALLFLAAPGAAAQEAYVPNEILVTLEQGTTLSQHFNPAKEIVPGVYKAELVDESIASAMIRLRNQPGVRHVQPNYIYSASAFIPNDPLYAFQWHFETINVSDAWETDVTDPDYGGDPGVVVAVLDTGVAFEDYSEFSQAPDLAGTRFVPGHDFVNGDAHPNDDNGHGTHMTGTIAQTTNNSVGMAGLAFHTTIMPVKVLDEAGHGTTEQIIAGIDFAITNDADILNMSFGAAGDGDLAYEEALDAAAAAGLVMVAAAGNAGADQLQFPANYDSVIGVTAIRYDETRPSYANYGSGLSLSAPGGDTNVDQNEDGTADGILQQSFTDFGQSNPDPTSFANILASGTSSATAHVSGAAALLLAAGTPAEAIQNILESTAKDLGAEGYDTQYGNGLLDIGAAITFVLGDEDAPNTTLSTSLEANGSNNYFLVAPKISLTALDVDSGIANTYFRWDDEEYTAYLEPFTPPEGTHELSFYSTDVAGNNETANQAEFTLDTRRVVTGANQGGGPQVRVFSSNGTLTTSFFAYAEYFRGGVNVAVGDVDGDGNDEIVTAPGPGGGPHIRVFSLAGNFERDFFAYDSGFRGGVNLAVGNVDGGKAEIVTAPMAGGGPNVRIFGFRDGSFLPTTENFMAYDANFRGGVNLAIIDLEGNGLGEIVTAPASNGGPQVRIFGFRDGVFVPVILGMMAYNENFRGGVTLTGGDVDGDGRDEIITGVASSGGPQVRIFGRQPDETVQLEHPGFMAFSPDFRGGINLTSADYQADGIDEIVVAVRNDGSPILRYFNRNGDTIYAEWQSYAESFKKGFNVASPAR
ncbi:MAG: S8 family serine peptidase [bacterium]|nr:S8 family serine peptidase [bacterium]